MTYAKTFKVDERAQQVKATALKPGDLSLSHRIHMVERE